MRKKHTVYINKFKHLHQTVTTVVKNVGFLRGSLLLSILYLNFHTIVTGSQGAELPHIDQPIHREQGTVSLAKSAGLQMWCVIDGGWHPRKRHSLKLTAKASENRPFATKGNETSIPTIHFSGAKQLLVLGRASQS